MISQEAMKFVRTALECSIYLDPDEPGLTDVEIFEIGSRMGHKEGEIKDAMRDIVEDFTTSYKNKPPQHVASIALTTLGHNDPSFLSVIALDFLYSELQENIRSMGIQNIGIERNVLVERAVAQKISGVDMKAVISISVIAGYLHEKVGFISRPPFGDYNARPSDQLRQQPFGPTVTPEASLRRRKIYEHVKDVIGRRTDGRGPSTEPLDAFASALEKLGYGQFRLWWMQTVGELRRSDTQSAPVSTSVLAAALVEGALTFVVKHARTRDLPVMASKTFTGLPRTWKIDDLVASASSGGPSAILDPSARQRADNLIRIRQRIHAGRMLSDYPQGVENLRPDEARDARSTADLVVRKIIDWLDKYPPN